MPPYTHNIKSYPVTSRHIRREDNDCNFCRNTGEY